MIGEVYFCIFLGVFWYLEWGNVYVGRRSRRFYIGGGYFWEGEYWVIVEEGKDKEW